MDNAALLYPFTVVLCTRGEVGLVMTFCLEFSVSFGWRLPKLWLQDTGEDREKLQRQLCKLGRSKGVYLRHAFVRTRAFIANLQFKTGSNQ